MKPYSKILFRVPQFPVDAELASCWEELKKSIALASPEFYKLIEHTTSDKIQELPDRIQTTLFKYFNRANHRAVPFGTFASFGIIENGERLDSPPILADDSHIHRFHDWKYHNQYPYSFDDVKQANYKLFANSSYYKIGSAIRYIKRKAETFELAEIDFQPMVIHILKICTYPIPYSEVIALSSRFKQLGYIEDLIEDLILCQLLITSLDANITGDDYFQRRQINFHPNEHQAYILTERNLQSGSFPSKLLRHFPALIKLLEDCLSDGGDSEDLVTFRSRFSKRFGGQTVSIMQALDPEQGVGYGQMEISEKSSTIIKSILSKQSDKVKSAESQLLDFLKTADKPSDISIIRLDKFKIDAKDTKPSKKLPNTLGLLFKVADDLIVLENIGGHSINQLAGRFTLASSGMQSFCTEMAALEQAANPHILFFDIAYQAENSVDNVNRRQSCYGLELNILNYSQLEKPVTLDDLYLNISGDQVILRSKRLGLRMVPRMASAYNYRRSELPVFRLLYDLAFHGIRSDLQFDFMRMFPNQRYYPRVQFRNIILSTAKLRVNNSQVKGCLASERADSLRNILLEMKMTDTIRIGTGDETLSLDLKQENHCTFLLEQLQHRQELIIEEIPTKKLPLLVDGKGRHFDGQFLLPMVHHQEIYYGSAAIGDDLERRIYPPGSEWLSLEIYCHATRGNDILSVPLSHFLEKHKNLFKTWFFIRYNEQGDHIRFRLHLKDAQDTGIALGVLHGLLAPFLTDGLVSDLQIKSYAPELERYAVAGMWRVEQHFMRDSNYVLWLLKKIHHDEQKYIHCLRLFFCIKANKLIGRERFENWIENIKMNLSQEHNMDMQKFKQVNQFMKSSKLLLIPRQGIKPHSIDNQFLNSLISILKRCPEQRRAPLFTDLMHMHINRLFSEHQRSHEFIIYTILDAQLKMDINRSSTASPYSLSPG